MIVICDLIYLGQFDYNTQTTNYSIYIRDHICWHPLYQQNKILIVLKLPYRRWLPMSAGLKRSSSTARSPWPWPSSTRPTSLPSNIDKPTFMMDAEIRSMIFHQQFYLRFSFLICLSFCLSICHQRYQRVHPWTSPDLFSRWLWRSVLCYDVPLKFHLRFSFLVSLCLSICLIVCLSIWMSVCLYVWVSNSLSAYLSTYLSTYLSSTRPMSSPLKIDNLFSWWMQFHLRFSFLTCLSILSVCWLVC